MEEILSKYHEQVKGYIPFVLLTIEQGELFHTFDKNEHKHGERNRKSCVYEEIEDFAITRHHMFHFNPVDEEFMHNCLSKAMEAYLNKLKPLQKSRVERRYLYGYTLTEIAKQDGVSVKAIHDTVQCALKNLAKHKRS